MLRAEPDRAYIYVSGHHNEYGVATVYMAPERAGLMSNAVVVAGAIATMLTIFFATASPVTSVDPSAPVTALLVVPGLLGVVAIRSDEHPRARAHVAGVRGLLLAFGGLSVAAAVALVAAGHTAKWWWLGIYVREDDVAGTVLSEPYRQLLAADLTERLKVADGDWARLLSEPAKESETERTPDFSLVGGSNIDPMVDLAGQRVDLILIDVFAGGEIDVLPGATRLLATEHPNVIVECHGRDYERVCGDLLVSAGYQPRVVTRRRLLPQNIAPLSYTSWLVA